MDTLVSAGIVAGPALAARTRDLKLAREAALQGERARRVATVHRAWLAVASFAGSTGGGFDQAAGRSSIWTPEGVAFAQSGPESRSPAPVVTQS